MRGMQGGGVPSKTMSDSGQGGAQAARGHATTPPRNVRLLNPEPNGCRVAGEAVPAGPTRAFCAQPTETVSQSNSKPRTSPPEGSSQETDRQNEEQLPARRIAWLEIHTHRRKGSGGLAGGTAGWTGACEVGDVGNGVRGMWEGGCGGCWAWVRMEAFWVLPRHRENMSKESMRKAASA